MRIWSLHPKYLDTKGLVAVWRETLLAQKVLRGQTKGYRYHPQLERFRTQGDPVSAIASYLTDIASEADTRGYTFDRSRIGPINLSPGKIPVTSGQIDYEWQHLLAKLAVRDPKRLEALRTESKVDPHPLFEIVPGDIEPWEKQT